MFFLADVWSSSKSPHWLSVPPGAGVCSPGWGEVWAGWAVAVRCRLSGGGAEQHLDGGGPQPWVERRQRRLCSPHAVFSASQQLHKD